MAEYPPRTCGPCPYLGKHENVVNQGDFLSNNSVPAPHIELQNKTNLNEQLLGVNSCYIAPDLSATPISKSNTNVNENGIGNATRTPANNLHGNRSLEILQSLASETRSRQCCLQSQCKNTKPTEICPDSPYNLQKLCQDTSPSKVEISRRQSDNSYGQNKQLSSLANSKLNVTPSKIARELCGSSSQHTGNRYGIQDKLNCVDNNKKSVTFLAQSSEKNPDSNLISTNDQQLGIIGAKHTPYGEQSSDKEIKGQVSETPRTVKGILKNSESFSSKNMIDQGEMQQMPADPYSDVPVPSNLRPEPKGRGPCYLPQPEDEVPAPLTEMGPLGPWATGRVDWSPLAGLTGTRPVVDKYSIARFSEGEWRKHNKEMLDMANSEQHKANLIEWNGRQCLEQTRADVDKNQYDNTRRLSQRSQDVHRWKCELERAIAAASEEISLMEEQRRRLKRASAVLMLPESIAGEALDRRTGRLDPELVRDIVEEELLKELSLTAELRETFYRTLKDIEKQLEEDKTAKQRLEYDWSDKKQAHEIDSLNVALNNRSTILMFKPGATIFPDEQSSLEYWEYFTRETLQEAEATRQRSVALRGTLDAILINAARDLRSQADRVELALSKRVACTEEVRIRLEDELRKILQRLADVEDTIRDIRQAIRNMDNPMKKAQTRLDNRNQRPRVENCRDTPHFGLIEEVKLIGESVTQLSAQLKQAEESQASLIKARNNLEREIMVKRKTLEIDRDRTQLIRSYYPSATALSGYA